MASWQAKHRDPLFDQSTQAALERRGKEVLGASLVVLGVLIAMMLASYAPEDPSFMSATDQPAQNYLGRIGAYVASALYMITGHGSWVLVIGGAVWGLRLMLHRGEERIMRGIFLPIAMVLVSIYATSMTPPPGWTQSFGLGGHLGDMLMGAMLSIMPIKASIAIKVLALLTAAGALAFLSFVLGFDRVELSAIGGFLRRGLATARLMLLHAVDKSARMSSGAARELKTRADARRERVARAGSAALPEPRIHAPGSATPRRYVPTAPGPGEAFSPQPELVEPETHYDEDDEGPSDVEISARINQAIHHRTDRPGDKGSVLSAVTAKLTGGRAAPRIEPEFADEDDEDEDDLPAGRGPAVAARQVHVAPRIPAPVSGSGRGATAESFGHYERPPLSLLTAPSTSDRHQLPPEALMENARMLEAVLDDYGVKGQITDVRPGPVVTLYELEPAPGLKASRVIGLADDIARSMSALSARVSTVPGRSVIGIELPNARREKVVLREILAAPAYADGTQPLPLALGKDIGGGPVVANLAKMPHLLIAGTTGSGKSVAINTMILSLLYKLTPEECRLIMIDPKMLELSVYDGIPHLLSPVVTDPKKAVVALKWVVGEMEERYRKMSKMGVRNIEGYNGRVREALAKDEMFKRTVQTGFDEDTGEPIFETEEFQPETFPYIVVIVDEMADLMMVAGKEIEACIQRLAQMARASGIHIIMATQRPSVDVITGTIKANFPTRISFQVTSKIDSRTILGEQGAEQLLGMGDMLYMAGGSKITRVHGPFVSDEEVEEIVNHLKSFGPPTYMSGVVEGPDEERADSIDQVLGLSTGEGGDAELYDLAVAIVAKDRKCSTSYIQRKLAIGYNKAARLVEQMEDQGVVSAANHVGKREVLVPEV
ncbi:DNA translocase FtsK 4TM domain-containing protein [Paracoccus sp. CPCC 101403]|uniref:DNA translocase FtsK n=2 Tax=Paracoccus broussonetiae TaxID=3075834 RepID=A0ABU3EFV2_9RHOB|nr:DNA translocase FtsK 4TM domain-containing protein [Paracoccus sp. CPCC 101403]MDT1063123.1 DNA translocase FtsK 4TM domain-containing protein [Paracoccus sp. CPCC 101403]